MSRHVLVRRLLPVLLAPVLAVALLPVWAETGTLKRYALLVGVNTYEHPKLPALKYAENDATELAAVLGKAGYEVTLLTSSAKEARLRPTKANLEARLKEVLRKCRAGDTVVVALAGHGVHFAGHKDSYFCPTDARPFADETSTLVSLRALYGELDRSFAGVKLLLVDACRDDPRAGRGTRGIDGDTAPRPPSGVAALFSCRSGQRAFEDEKLAHGVFFHYVLQGLRGKARNSDNEVTFLGLAEYVTRQVSRDVPRRIGGGARQSPSLNARELSGEPPVLLTLADRERPPDGDSRSRPGKAAPEGKVERPGKLAKRITNSIKMKLVLIPRGTFTMGSPASESSRSADEEQHEVEITKPFYLGVTEVTQGQFKRVMGYNPSHFSRDGKGKAGLSYLDISKPGRGSLVTVIDGRVVDLKSTDDLPVENVSWQEAQTFLKKLSARPEEKKQGRQYRLPTEAEWEYSCRAGAPAKNPFHYGPSLASTQANFKGDSPYSEGPWREGPWLIRTAAVGSYAPNAFGLYDMHGNVDEWCADWYDKGYYRDSPKKDPKGPEDGTRRVLRGGGWFSNGYHCRAAARWSREPGYRDYQSGFRVVCVPVARTP
jgi:formylglycine-generating enzyme required for sulfatase activity